MSWLRIGSIWSVERFFTLVGDRRGVGMRRDGAVVVAERSVLSFEL